MNKWQDYDNVVPLFVLIMSLSDLIWSNQLWCVCPCFVELYYAGVKAVISTFCAKQLHQGQVNVFQTGSKQTPASHFLLCESQTLTTVFYDRRCGDFRCGWTTIMSAAQLVTMMMRDESHQKPKVSQSKWLCVHPCWVHWCEQESFLLSLHFSPRKWKLTIYVN